MQRTARSTSMEKRKAIPVPIREQVLMRDDNRCQKCGKYGKLDLHHIVPVAQKGQETVENLIALCVRCHREWEHLIYPQVATISFEQWLELPTCAEFLAIFADKDMWPDDLAVSMKEVRNALIIVHRVKRQSHFWLLDEDLPERSVA